MDGGDHGTGRLYELRTQSFHTGAGLPVMRRPALGVSRAELSSAGIRSLTTLLRDEKGLLATVFDLSFKHFVTLRIVRWLFVLGIVAITIAAVFR